MHPSTPKAVRKGFASMSKEKVAEATQKSAETRRNPVVFTREEAESHRAAIAAQLATTQCEERHVVRAMKKRFGLTPARTRALMRELLDAWTIAREDPRALEDARSRALARIDGYITSARGIPKTKRDKDGNLVQVGWETRPHFSALAKFEQIKMRLEGTEKPVKVDLEVRHTQALIGVVAGLTHEQVEQLRSAHEERERFAEIGRRALLTSGDSQVLPKKGA